MRNVEIIDNIDNIFIPIDRGQNSKNNLGVQKNIDYRLSILSGLLELPILLKNCQKLIIMIKIFYQKGAG